MKVQGVTSFCAREALSQPSYLPRNSWKNLLTAFSISVPPSSNPSPLWRCCSSRNWAICTWGCWGRCLCEPWKELKWLHWKCKVIALSWKRQKPQLGRLQAEHFSLILFHPWISESLSQKIGVRLDKGNGKHGGKCVCQPHSGRCLCSNRLSIKGAGLYICFDYLSFNSLL